MRVFIADARKQNATRFASNMPLSMISSNKAKGQRRRQKFKTAGRERLQECEESVSRSSSWGTQWPLAIQNNLLKHKITKRLSGTCLDQTHTNTHTHTHREMWVQVRSTFSHTHKYIYTYGYVYVGVTSFCCVSCQLCHVATYDFTVSMWATTTTTKTTVATTSEWTN